MTVVQQNKVQPTLYRSKYNRCAVKTGVVHLGYGAFHRAHQAIYFDDYMDKTGDLNWGIAAVNLRASEAQTFAASKKVTDGYLVKTTAADGLQEMRLVRSHVNFVDWSVDHVLAEQLLAEPNVHIITITVTESGYFLNADGNLDLNNPTIAHEIDGGELSSVYAFLAHALKIRMEQLDEPISILCCDNIRSNGHMLRKNLTNYLQVSGNSTLAQWVLSNCSFPCSMVDRITPRATSELHDEVSAIFDDTELDPIHAESFTQWVLENNFAGPKPELYRVGVEVVSDVDPYEEAKIRILNGGHTALAYLGALAGYQTFDEAMRDSKLRVHFDNFEKLEVLPGLTVDLPFDRALYLDEITDRFCNKAIADQLERICMDGFSKMQLYIRPTLTSCLAQGMQPVYSYACIASWYVYARRFKSGDMPIPYHEPYWDQLSPMLNVGEETKFATNTQLWGELPQIYPEFTSALVAAIEKMDNSWPA